MDTADIILRAALVGIGGTIVLDLYAFLMQRMFGVPTNWKMVGRWLGRMSRVRSDKHRAGRAGAGRTCAGLDIPLCDRHRLRPAARRDLGCRMAASAWDCRAADPRPCAAHPALFRDDAGHGYGNGWIADAYAQCDSAEERDRPLHVRHRHVSDRQAYGSCWLITAGRERPSYARLNEQPFRCSVAPGPRLLAPATVPRQDFMSAL